MSATRTKGAAVSAELDALIDQAVRPKCLSAHHRLPEGAQAVVRRAQERITTGESINASRLATVLTREFGHRISDDALRRYLKEGCACER